MTELVYSGGRIVLAAFCGRGGNEALREILFILEETVFVELMLYNEARVILSKEFNPSCLVMGENRYSFISGLMQEGEDNSDFTAVDPCINDEFDINESEIRAIASGFCDDAELFLRKRDLGHLIVREMTGTMESEIPGEEPPEELRTEIEFEEIYEGDEDMNDHSRYQKMIINTLARKLGPAAGDFAEDMAKKTGTKFSNIFPGNIEVFATHVERNIVQFIKPEEAKFIANTIRRLRA